MNGEYVFTKVVMSLAFFMVGIRLSVMQTKIIGSFSNDEIVEHPNTNCNKQNSYNLIEICLNHFGKTLSHILPYYSFKKLLISNPFAFRIQEEHEEVEGIFEELTQRLHISNAMICVDNNSMQHISAHALLKPFFIKGKHIVTISAFSIEFLDKKELEALIAHELIHIKKRDYRYKPFVLSLFLIFSVFGILLFLAFLQDLTMDFCPWLSLLLLFISLIAFLIFLLCFLYFSSDRHGYWFQIRELRADRMACEYLMDDNLGMLSLLRKIEQQEKDFLFKRVWYETLILRYINWVTHPSTEYRIKKIENYKKWSYSDYFKHFWQTIKWTFSGRGWSGF